jgi:hypothetical protein
LVHRVGKRWLPFGRHSFSKLMENFLLSASLVFQVGPVRRVGRRRGQEREASLKLLRIRTACVHHRRRQAYRRDSIQERGQATDHHQDHQEGHQDQERGHLASKVLGHRNRLRRDG